MTIPVVNKRNIRPEEGDVYIGRGSPWGNRYVIGVDGKRAEVIAKYEAWIAERPGLVERLVALGPRRLVCYCAPAACHGDVLAALLEARTIAARGER